MKAGLFENVFLEMSFIKLHFFSFMSERGREIQHCPQSPKRFYAPLISANTTELDDLRELNTQQKKR